MTADLSRLELLGYVKRSFTGAYSRTALARPDEPVARATIRLRS